MKKLVSVLFFSLMLFGIMGFTVAAQQGSPMDKSVTGSNGEPMLYDQYENGSENGVGQMIKTRVHAGNYTSESGEQIRIRELVQNRLRIHIGNSSMDCDCDELNLTQEQVQNRTQLKAKLSNGRNAEVKIMPNVASERALERLKLKSCNNTEVNCSIELKEVGQGNQTKLAYEIKAQKTFKILGFIKNKENVMTQIDAETGEQIRSQRPWWSFLATESDEAEEI